LPTEAITAFMLLFQIPVRYKGDKGVGVNHHA